jgi:hypothetical protein
MAKIRVYNDTKKVVTTVDVPMVQLDITVEQARILRTILGQIFGKSDQSVRKVTAPIYDALTDSLGAGLGEVGTFFHTLAIHQNPNWKPAD